MLLTQTQDKPKLNKHIEHLTYIYKHKNKGKSKKSDEPKLETLPQHQNSLEMVLTILLNQSIHDQIKEELVNLELKDQDQKGPNQEKFDLRMFCEKFSL